MRHSACASGLTSIEQCLVRVDSFYDLHYSDQGSPSLVAIDRARIALRACQTLHMLPSAVAASAKSGVGLGFAGEGWYGALLLHNDGGAHAEAHRFFHLGKPEQIETWGLVPTTREIRNALRVLNARQHEAPS